MEKIRTVHTKWIRQYARFQMRLTLTLNYFLYLIFLTNINLYTMLAMHIIVTCKLFLYVIAQRNRKARQGHVSWFSRNILLFILRHLRKNKNKRAIRKPFASISSHIMSKIFKPIAEKFVLEIWDKCFSKYWVWGQHSSGMGFA